jgi:DNA polymerase II small subunit/DNA polymerase delta subunit B
MNEKNKHPNDGIIPDDGTYIGSKKGKALREQRLKEEFNKAWESQKILLKDSQVKLYKDKANIGLQWQSYVNYDGFISAIPNRIKKS